MDNSQIIGELHRKYDNTYIMSKDNKGELFTCFVEAIETEGSGNSATGRMKLNSIKYGKLQYTIPSNEAIIFKQPEMDTFQSGPFSYLVYRQPNRQWQRGLSKNNTGIVNISKYVSNGAQGFPNTTPLKIDLVTDLMEGKSKSFEEAWKTIKTGKFSSVAIKNGWSLVLPIHADGQYILMYRLNVAAFLTNDGKIHKLMNSGLKTSIQTLMGETS